MIACLVLGQVLGALVLGALICADCVGSSCARAAPVQAETRAREGAPFIVTVSSDNRGLVPAEGLAIELMAIKDNRCAVEVKCVWAGYAEITLQVSKAGAAAAPVIMGDLPAAQAGAASRAVYGPYRFELLGLEPANSMSKPVELSRYRARIQVTKLPG